MYIDSPLTLEDIVKFERTIKESDVQKLAKALRVDVREFDSKQKKIVSMLLKWEEDNKGRAALVQILDKNEIPHSL